MKRKHDKRTNVRLAKMQQRHWDEKIALGRQLSVRRGLVEQEIEKFYGESERRLKSEIKEMQTQLDQTGFKGWWFRVWKGEATKTDLKNTKKTLENLQWRKGERMQVIQNDESSEKDRLELKQRSEKEVLENHLRMSTTYPAIKEAFEKQRSVSKSNTMAPKQVLSPGRSR